MQHHSVSRWVCSPECTPLHGQLERLNCELIANQTTSIPRPAHGHSEKLLVFKYSAGPLCRTVYISVATLIMQGLCDAISKRGKVQMNHWGRIPLPPCASMHACCCTSEPKMKAGIHVVEASLHLNRVDTLTVSCHMFSLCNEAAKEGEERDELKEGKNRQSSFTCWTSLGYDLVVIDHHPRLVLGFRRKGRWEESKNSYSCH